MISIALTTYNGEKYLAKQLDTIINQTKKPDEIVVCDDLSNDSTLNILEKYKQKYNGIEWNIVKNERQLGFANNFRKAINLCKGDYIFVSDQDDVWVNTKIADMINVLQNNSKIKVLFCKYDCIDENDNLIESYKYKYNNSLKLKFKEIFNKVIPITLKQHINTRNIAGMMMCLKKDEKILKDFNQIKSENLYSHDSILAMIASKYNGLYMYNKILVHYRLHGKNTMGIEKALEGSKPDRLSWLKGKINGAKYLLKCAKDLNDKKIIEEINKEIEFDNYRINCLENGRKPALMKLVSYNSLPAYIGDLIYEHKNNT